MYERLSNIGLPASASCLPSNLAVIFHNEKLYTGVVNKGQFIISCPSMPEHSNVINKVIPKVSPQQQVLQGNWIWSENPLLVLVTTGAVQVFDWDGAILLHTHQMSNSCVTMEKTSFFRGIVGLPSGRICIGMHTGEILVLALKDSDNLAILEEDKQKWFCRPVTAMASYFSDLVAADDSGAIMVGQDAETFHKTLVIKSQGEYVTCLQLFKNKIIAGYVTGHIRIYCMVIGQLLVEVCAHANTVSCLDIARASGMLLSVSEDSFAKIWKLDFSIKTSIEHKYSKNESNALLCGGSFKDSSASGYLLTAYDLPFIISYSM